MEREEILRVEGLKQYFKLGSGKNKMLNKAVDDVSFTIYKGEVFSIVGESGCGKTTTGRTIIKLYPSWGGEVFFHGQRIISDVKRARQIHKENVRQFKESLTTETAELNERLQAHQVSQETYNELHQDIVSKYSEERSGSLDMLRSAKRDRRFESIIDEESKKARFNVDTLPQYKEIEDQYAQTNQEIAMQITELKKRVGSKSSRDSELASEISKLQKELKLNAIRKKQDFSKLRYRLLKKNRILMRQMQMIFQDPIASLNPRMTVKEIIAEGLRINGVRNEKEIQDKVIDALKTVGLVPDHASRYPHEFSGGQRQRIGIARALVVEPSFIIADEPISALDVSIRAQIINLLNDLRVEKGITIMFIAHDLSVVKYFSDRLAVMYYGRLVEIGNKDAIFNNPLHPYTHSLLASIPLPDPEYEKHRKKTERYNPAKAHDYSKEAPSLREVEEDHFVLCNTEEFERYLEITKNQ